MIGKLGPGLLRLSGLAIWAYLCMVVIYRIHIAGLVIGPAPTLVVFLAGSALILVLPGTAWLRRRLRPSRMGEVGLALLFTALTLFLAETVYAGVGNARRAEAVAPLSATVRMEDSTVWHGELLPRIWFPTDDDFVLYKPDVRVSATTYGEFYTSAMLRSPTLVDSLLERHPLSYVIGPHGVRETEPLDESRIFALGDSYAMGYETDEGLTWTDVLGRRLGEPVYDLGVSGSGPRAQLSLLEYFFDTQADSLHIEHLLWMLFEGNDLENSYVRKKSPPPPPGRVGLLDGTVLQALASIPGRARNQSLLRKLLDRGIDLAVPGDDGLGEPIREIDGVTLELPLYRSDRLGYKMFSAQDVRGVTHGPEYLRDHPNRPALEATFREMKALADEHGFRVTIVIAPSAARVYGASFDGFPTLSERPWLVDYLFGLAGDSGFGTVNLLPLLAPYAESELLYYRDDHHWNPRGNALVAEWLEPVVRAARNPPTGTPSGCS
ncbi:MAG: hypothetical protein PVH00_13110 [Gemmatimonadota bacterium]